MRIKFTRVTIFATIRNSDNTICTKEFDGSGEKYANMINAIRYMCDRDGSKLMSTFRETKKDEIEVPISYILKYKPDDQMPSDAKEDK